MPTFHGCRQAMGVPRVKGPVPVRCFDGVPVTTPDQHFTIAGVTKDSAGAPLGACTVDVFRTEDDSIVERTTSDGSGNYSVGASSQLTHYAVAYKAGAPDVAGTTVNTLVGT